MSTVNVREPQCVGNDRVLTLANIHCPVCGQGVLDDNGHFRDADEHCQHLILFEDQLNAEGYVSPRHEKVMEMRDADYETGEIAEYLEKEMDVLLLCLSGPYLGGCQHEDYTVIFHLNGFYHEDTTV